MIRLTLHVIEEGGDDEADRAAANVTNITVSKKLGASMLRTAADELDPPQRPHRVTRGGSEEVSCG